MSAYIVTDNHIHALINFAIAKRASFYFHPSREDVTTSNAQEIGQTLLDENYRSVNYRYRETEAAPRYQTNGYRSVPDPVSALKLINCLDYQCCETDDWATTKARAILDGIQAAAIRALPGYDAAPWGLYK